MDIKGWVRTSLIDYPEHIASVIFTGGCNFRCPMCHNANLVLHPEDVQSVSEQDLWSFLHKRAGLIDGLVVSGGEPTLQKNLIPFLMRVKALGLHIKLDTNGTRPDIITEILHLELVDFIAMDIKAPPSKYPLLTGLPLTNTSAIINSLDAILSKPVTFELRTTVVPKLLDSDDIAAIAQWLAGIMSDMPDRGSYVLQQFRGLYTLDPDLSRYTPYSKKHLYEMAETAKRWLPYVKVRGV